LVDGIPPSFDHPGAEQLKKFGIAPPRTASTVPTRAPRAARQTQPPIPQCQHANPSFEHVRRNGLLCRSFPLRNAASNRQPGDTENCSHSPKHHPTHLTARLPHWSSIPRLRRQTSTTHRSGSCPRKTREDSCTLPLNNTQPNWRTHGNPLTSPHPVHRSAQIVSYHRALLHPYLRPFDSRTGRPTISTTKTLPRLGG
jgi:hypothetical protein